MQTRYGFGKSVAFSFNEAVDRAIQALQTEGFGVLTDIDVAATMKRKLGKEMPPYRILGACNPSLASQAIDAEPSIGLLLPCNVVVRQDLQGQVHVEFLDPNILSELVDAPPLAKLSSEVRTKLERVMKAV